MQRPFENYGLPHKEVLGKQNLPSGRTANHLRKGTVNETTKRQPAHFQYVKTGSTIRSECGASRRKDFSGPGSKIRQRIEKACTTFSTNDLQKQISLLRKQLERLEKEILKKDQQIINSRSSSLSNKESKAEIEEVYRSLHFYEGRVAELEAQVDKFRHMILNAPPEGVNEASLSLLFDELRKDNEELHAHLEEASYLREVADNRFKKLEASYFEIHRELAEYKRKEASPLNHLRMDNPISQQKMNKVINEIVVQGKNQESMESKEQEVLLRHYSNRLLKAQDQTTELRDNLMDLRQNYADLQEKHQKLLAQNEILRMEINQKNEQNAQLFKKYALARKSLRELDPGMTMSKLGSRLSLTSMRNTNFKPY